MKFGAPDIPEHIDKLIYREVAGIITEQEYKILLSWMYEEKKNWALYTERKVYHKKKKKELDKKASGGQIWRR